MSAIHPPETYSDRYLVVGEGAAERVFSLALLRDAAMRDSRFERHFQVVRHADGNGDFLKRLNGIVNASSFAGVPGIVLVTDADDDPKKAFENVAKQVSAVKLVGGGKLLPPGAPWTLGPSKGDAPPVAILVLPDSSSTGTLESLLLRPLGARWPDEMTGVTKLHTDLNKYATQVGKRAKSEMACMVAVCCEDDPACTILNLWQADKKMASLLADAHFDPIRNFLLSLPWTPPVAAVSAQQQSAASATPSVVAPHPPSPRRREVRGMLAFFRRLLGPREK